MSFEKKVAFLTVVTLPFTNLFALGVFTNFSFLFALFFLFLQMYNYKKFKMNFTSKFILGIIFLSLLLIFLLLISGEMVGSYFTKDIRMYIFLLLYSIALYNITRKYGINLISKWLYYGLYIAFIFGIIDFIFANILRHSLDNYLYRFRVQYNGGTIATLYRIRSTIDEPGHFSYYINAIFPLSLLFMKKKDKIYIILGIINFLLTFSAAGFAVLLITIITLLLTNKMDVKKIIYILFFIGSMFFINQALKNNIYYKLVTSKIFLKKGEMSANDRLNRLEIGEKYLRQMFKNNGIKNFFLGYGSGFFVDTYKSGLINYYFQFFLEKGFFMSIYLITFLLFQLKKSYEISGEKGILIRYSLISSLVHLVIIQNIFFYYIWYVFAIIDNNKGESKK